MKIGEYEYSIQPELCTNATRFVSLSRNNKNLLMWSHYADSHKGFCIGFSRQHNYFKAAESVRYRRYRSNLNGASIDSTTPDSIAKMVALEKAIDWAYEEEERLFLDDVKINSQTVGIDLWGQEILLNKFPQSAIASIYFGLRADESLKNEALSIAKQKNLKIDFFQAKKKVNEFAIEFCQINKGI
ncbi:DUF2971 domain-containing protein [Stutzerimonas stutzeri]|nr:DUF2971 domain-containing protein [Stutzerimonas stutzeri]